jgi:RNA polymerase sigma-70 factor (ECF subfamily)
MSVMAIRSQGSDPPQVEDGKLVQAAAGGDRQAYGTLYDRYAHLVRAICYDRTGDVTQSEDLCQEVFLTAHRGLGQIRKPERFAAWLIAITKLTCRNWVRLSRRQRSHLATVDMAALPEGAANEVDATDELRQLHRWLLRLPEKERMAIQICCLLEEAPERARMVLKLSRSGLYALLDRAKKRLKRLAESQREEDSHG